MAKKIRIRHRPVTLVEALNVGNADFLIQNDDTKFNSNLHCKPNFVRSLNLNLSKLIESVKNCVLSLTKKPVIMAEETNNAFNHTINCLIDNKSTDFICHKFVNKYLLIITQYEKLTNFFTVQKQVLLNANSHNSLIVNNNFGTDTDEIKAGIMFLLNDSAVWNEDGNSVQISIGLKNINRNILLDVKKVLKQFDL